MSKLIPTSLITPSHVSCSNDILRWADEYLAKPHPRLGRDGAVCPFVPPSIRSNVFFLAIHAEVDDTTTIEEIEALLASYVDVFFATEPTGEPERLLKTFLPAFPQMSPQRAFILDEVHARMKSFFVQQGMMIGQFHPLCQAVAARNPDFPNKISPVPLFALRHIAVHDILFLSSRRAWFERYQSLFAEKFDAGHVSNEHGFVEIYNRAKRLFATSTDDAGGEREC